MKCGRKWVRQEGENRGLLALWPETSLTKEPRFSGVPASVAASDFQYWYEYRWDVSLLYFWTRASQTGPPFLSYCMYSIVITPCSEESRIEAIDQSILTGILNLNLNHNQR